MKKLLLFSILICPLALTSCGTNDSIRQITNYELTANEGLQAEITNLTTTELINFLDAKLNFPLYFYSKNCGSCATVSGFVTTYISDHDAVIYGYDYGSNMSDYHLLNEYDPELFPNRVVTPRMLIIKNGMLSVEINSSKYGSHHIFAKTVSHFVGKSSLYTLNKFETFNTFKNNFDSYFAFAYSSKNKDSLRLISQFLYEHSASYYDPTLLLDIEKMSQCDIDSFTSFLGVGNFDDYCFYKKEDTNLFVSNYKNSITNLHQMINRFFY